MNLIEHNHLQFDECSTNTTRLKILASLSFLDQSRLHLLQFLILQHVNPHLFPNPDSPTSLFSSSHNITSWVLIWAATTSRRLCHSSLLAIDDQQQGPPNNHGKEMRTIILQLSRYENIFFFHNFFSMQSNQESKTYFHSHTNILLSSSTSSSISSSTRPRTHPLLVPALANSQVIFLILFLFFFAINNKWRERNVHCKSSISNFLFFSLFLF